MSNVTIYPTASDVAEHPALAGKPTLDDIERATAIWDANYAALAALEASPIVHTSSWFDCPPEDIRRNEDVTLEELHRLTKESERCCLLLDYFSARKSEEASWKLLRSALRQLIGADDA